MCCKEGWKLIYAGSRFTKDAESRYAPVEGEALALAWGLEHSRIFTLGCNDLLVAVDHQPLLGIFNDRELSNIKNPRLQSIKESTLAWRFSIVHCAGKWNRGPDALTRQSSIASLLCSLLLGSPSLKDDDRCDNASYTCQVASINAINKLTSITLDNVRLAANLDTQYQDLINIVKSGFPSKRNDTEPAHLLEFWEVRSRLFELHGIIYLDKRIVVPRLLRKIVLDNLHSANQGVTGMSFRANVCVYWPGLDNSIRN